MIKYRKNDWIYLNGQPKIIQAINKSYITIEGERYSINDIKPIPIEDCNNIIIERHSVNDNGNDCDTEYWGYVKEMIKKSTYKEENINFVHDLQHYLQKYSLGKLVSFL